MSTTTEQPDRVAQREAQLQQAEELLGAMPQKIGVAKGLFEGRFVADWVFPYPQLPASQQAEVERAVAELERFCDEHLDPESHRSRGRHPARSHRRPGAVSACSA